MSYYINEYLGREEVSFNGETIGAVYVGDGATLTVSGDTDIVATNNEIINYGNVISVNNNTNPVILTEDFEGSLDFYHNGNPVGAKFATTSATNEITTEQAKELFHVQKLEALNNIAPTAMRYGNDFYWVVNQEYEITYNLNGGIIAREGTDPLTSYTEEYTSGSEKTLPALVEGHLFMGDNTDEVTRDGYTFAGWYYLTPIATTSVESSVIESLISDINNTGRVVDINTLKDIKVNN